MRETSGGAVFARHARNAAVLAVAMMLVAPAAMRAWRPRGCSRTGAQRAGGAIPWTSSSVDGFAPADRAAHHLQRHHGASLLFNANTLTYYVALFQEKNFWRVIKTDAVDNAERVYRTFAQQSEQLAQVYIDTTRLEPASATPSAWWPANEERLRTLQQEMEQQQAQSAQVSAALQAQQQAVSLSTDVQSTNSQLDALQRRIQILQAEQGNPELSLPAGQRASPAPGRHQRRR